MTCERERGCSAVSCPVAGTVNRRQAKAIDVRIDMDLRLLFMCLES